MHTPTPVAVLSKSPLVALIETAVVMVNTDCKQEPDNCKAEPAEIVINLIHEDTSPWDSEAMEDDALLEEDPGG